MPKIKSELNQTEENPRKQDKNPHPPKTNTPPQKKTPKPEIKCIHKRDGHERELNLGLLFWSFNLSQVQSITTGWSTLIPNINLSIKNIKII